MNVLFRALITSTWALISNFVLALAFDFASIPIYALISWVVILVMGYSSIIFH